MRLPASARGRWTLAVALLALALVAFNLWWILTNRQGYPLNVDENGYTSIAVLDYLGLRGSGPHGWWEAVQSQTPNAPLLPAVTSLAMLVRPGVMAGFAVLTGFLALLVLASYGIGERLAGPRLGALAALIVGTSEGAILFTREYVFALPTAALLSCTVYALLRSERMAARRWAVACGVAIGLMVLARTMAVAFVPGVLAAAIALILAGERTGLRGRFLNLGLTGVAAIVVAATWYYHNLQPVLDYLTSYGYGAQSAYYGAQHAVVSWGRFRSVATQMIHDDLLVPLAAMVLAGLLVLAVVALRRVLAADNRRLALLRVVGSDAFAVAIVVVAGFAALMTSQNGGNGFTFPLSVLLPPLAVAALRYLRAAFVPVAVLAIVVAGLNLAATSNLWDGLSRERTVEVPAFGYQPWLSGAPRAVGAIRVQVPGPATHFDARDRGWTEADERLAAELKRRIDAGVVSPVVAFASRNRAISSNSVGLASLLYQHDSIPFTQLNAEPADTEGTYTRQLVDPELGPPGLLVTMSRNTDDFPPLVTQGKAEAAARRVGFHRVWTTTLPDGRKLRLWVKTARAPAVPAPGSRPG
jgi:Dolichyl-phosphate-mannose-protein mannosyltransferase